MSFSISISTNRYGIPKDFILPDIKMFGEILIKNTISGQGNYIFRGSTVTLPTGDHVHIDKGLEELYANFSYKLKGKNLKALSDYLSSFLIIGGIDNENSSLVVKFGGRTLRFKRGQEGKLIRYLDNVASPSVELKSNTSKKRRRLQQTRKANKRKQEFIKMVQDLNRSGFRPIKTDAKEYQTFEYSAHDKKHDLFIFLFPDTLVWEASQFKKRPISYTFMSCKGQGRRQINTYLFEFLNNDVLICDKSKYKIKKTK